MEPLQLCSSSHSCPAFVAHAVYFTKRGIRHQVRNVIPFFKTIKIFLTSQIIIKIMNTKRKCFFCPTVAMYRLHNTSEHSGVTNMYSLSNMASRSGTPVQGQTTTAALMHHPSYAASQNNLLGAGTGILVGGPNHHATINPQYGMEHLNGSSILSHSHTLPHNLSHHNSK